jgi:hypothetical protein
VRGLPALLLLAGCVQARGAGAVAEIEIAAAPAPTAEPAPPPSRAASVSILGRWKGMGEQTSGARWSMHVDLYALGPGFCGKVRYDGHRCEGEWVCTDKSDGRSLAAHERIFHGPCIPTGDMTMTVEKDGTLDWHWESGEEKAWARLQRTKDP